MALDGYAEDLASVRLRWFTVGDIDGFFGLFINGFPDLLLIVGLGPLCGFSVAFVTTRILPGVAVSVLSGNLFYAWQARRLARREGRDDVTAIPFGINTPTIFAYVFFIMAPIYTRTHDAALAWQAGVFASLISGVVQTVGAFCTDKLRRHTPRAALLSPLAGLSLAYLCLGFIFAVFDHGSIGLLPMLVLFALYSSKIKLPLRFPAGLFAVGLGAALVALLRHLHIYDLPRLDLPSPGLHLPQFVNIFTVLRRHEWWSYLAVILPLSTLDTLGSMMILESIKVEGDDYRTMPSLLMNGIGTFAAACLGSPFPTTIYLGHATHKANGARSGYSILNGIATLALCCTGVVPVVLHFVPLEVVSPVIIWFGLVTVGQAFIEVPRNQSVAVAMGLIPPLAQWATSLADTVARKAGSSLLEVAPRTGNDLPLQGLIAVGQGSLLSSMIWAATLALVIQHRFASAAGWVATASLLSAFGIIHAYTLTTAGVEGRFGWWAAPNFAISYAAGAAFLVLCEMYSRRIRPRV